MDEQLPALSVIGVPTKRTTILELAAEADRRGFAGLASPGVHGNLALCGSLAHVTTRIAFWTSIQPIYHSHPAEVAITAGHLHEVSGGRFRLGLGVSHAPAMDRLGVAAGKPLADIRAYVDGIRATERQAGTLPPIWLATLRDKMLHLAVEIADGAIWANGAFSHMAEQLATLPAAARETRSFANMAPTVIDADKDAARAIHRRTLSGYVTLPNYRNYWKAAGYEEEMAAIEDALAAGDRDRLPTLMTDAWIDDCTISGSAGEVRERLASWYELGVTPIAVMSSTTGGQAHAIGQLFELYAS
jgi:alkanesulfonate monooxygenase SsuD/methylene tetrahydromethanopterin reductase-like flavin-dependent oxidoreductase (luciferase family)